jgi:1-acyl-sn-glycerol-3-phosphate acyltransferase
MNISQTLVVGLIRMVTGISCRIDDPDSGKVPDRGPMILAINHINSLEVPLLAARLSPRKMVGLAKLETWNNKLMGWLFDMFNSIPIRRGEVDLQAVHACFRALSEEEILAVAPEGTRSYDGKLLLGRPGIVLIALHSGAPILPIAHWGGESFSRNLKRLKRTDFHIRVGRPFILDTDGEKPVGKVRQAMADEIMCQIAALMPKEYRGQYVNYDPPPMKHIRFV